MFFNDIAPGSQWQPEPAARYNAVNRLLSQGENFFPQNSDSSGRLYQPCGQTHRALYRRSTIFRRRRRTDRPAGRTQQRHLFSQRNERLR